MSSSNRLPAYALIVAINDPNGRGLKAPEPDAARLYSTLVSLGVPPTSIDLLIGPAATRQNIIRKLSGIAGNQQILRDAPILIYFAGHMGQQDLHIPGLGTCRTEFLIPYDTIAQPPNCVPPIPDVTISALLGRIARKTSNHITLLLDCCHAGSGSRDSDVDDTFNLPLKIDSDKLAELDRDLWSEALDKDNMPCELDGSSRASHNNHPLSLRYGGVTSHVLIASSHETQISQEYRVSPHPHQSLYTTALIEALEDCRDNRVILTVTHIGLFERIKTIMGEIIDDNRTLLRPQSPQCEGYHKGRPVFSTPALPHGSRAIAPLNKNDDRTITVPVGLLAGVQRHSAFEIYDYPQGRLALIDRLRVASLTDSQTILAPRGALEIGPDAYAVMCTPPTVLSVEMVGDFAALYSSQSFQEGLAQAFGSHERRQQFISHVRSGQVRVSYTGSRDEVEVQNVYGGILRFRGAHQIPEVLAKASTFFHHLDQTPVSTLGYPDITVWIHELTEFYNTDIHHELNILAPIQNRSIQMHPTRDCFVPESRDGSFGLEIVNRGMYDLYVYVFYFDPNDYSITPFYLPPTSDVPLPAGGKLKIGYGSSGAAPLGFTIDNGMDQDKGFVKLYYSTYPSEMGIIRQDGFIDGFVSRPSNLSDSRLPVVYGSITYPVIVH